MVDLYCFDVCDGALDGCVVFFDDLIVGDDVGVFVVVFVEYVCVGGD